MLSAMRVTGMPSCSSSHAVRRAPWSNGRVSSAKTILTLPSAGRGADDAERRAVAGGGERPRVAVGEDARLRGQQLRPEVAHRAGRPRGPRRWMARASSRRPCRRLARSRRPQRLEAPPHPLDRPEEVDRRGPRRGEVRRTSSCHSATSAAPSLAVVRTPRARPSAAATPIAGAPRIAMSRIAAATSWWVRQRRNDLLGGQAPLVDHHDRPRPPTPPSGPRRTSERSIVAQGASERAAPRRSRRSYNPPRP